MSKRYDACAPRKGSDGKTRWQKVGVAFEGERGTQVILDAYPIPDAEGRVVINLFEPRQNDAPRASSGRGEARQPATVDDDDPFGY